jgi:hypothetical protein
MKKLLLVPAIFVAACVDKPAVVTEEPTATETGQSTGGLGGGADNEDFDTPTLVAGFLQDPLDCDGNTVILVAHYGYTDGSAGEFTCQYVFADGSTIDDCIAIRSFPNGELVTLIVRDSSRGVETRYQDAVVGPQNFSATLDVTSNDLTITWDAHTLYGNFVDGNDVHISIEPASNVVETDPAFFTQFTGTAHVTQPGTYTVKLVATITFGEEGGCNAFVDKTVDVVGNGGGGGEEPPCDPSHAP